MANASVRQSRDFATKQGESKETQRLLKTDMGENSDSRNKMSKSVKDNGVAKGVKTHRDLVGKKGDFNSIGMMQTKEFTDISLKYVKDPDEYRRSVFTQLQDSKDRSNQSLFTRAANIDGMINEKVMRASPSRFLSNYDNITA